jgi:hypothetical protein
MQRSFSKAALALWGLDLFATEKIKAVEACLAS